MSSPSLETKTIRPGNLGAYSYYRSNRIPDKPGAALLGTGRRKLLSPKIIIILLVAVLAIGVPLVRANSHPVSSKKPVATKSAVHKTAPATPPAAAPVVAAPVAKAPDKCADNTLSKMVLVSISQRHLWACDGATTAYDSPVITGITAHASTLTPPGTYRIYSKQTDTTLTGSDVTGSWSDPVSYWMPFLSNQYGVYGFHDATWRSNDAFGNVSPDSSDASHGCVELPLAAAAWLYNWAYVGTSVTIES